MRATSSVAPVPRLFDRPATARDGRVVAETGRQPAADTGMALRGPVRGPGSAPARARVVGGGAYAAATYLAVAALHPPVPADAAVEVSVRALAGGGRVTVARHTAGGHTVGIEAHVA